MYAEHAGTLRTASNLAAPLSAQGIYAEAEQMQRKEHQAQKRVLGELCLHTQYNKRAKRQGYMLRNGQAHTLGKRAVEIGPATVERATRGRYDWQDGGLRKRRREDEREEGERRLRPRDPAKRGKHQ